MKTLDEMNKDELKAYARKNGIRLYTVVPEKMRKIIRDTEYRREHRGDAFCDAKMLERRNGARTAANS